VTGAEKPFIPRHSQNRNSIDIIPIKLIFYIYIYICRFELTSKTISVSEDAYELLKKMKLRGESFSDTIRRLAGRRRLADCAGLWSDIPEEEMQAFWGSVAELRKRTLESLGESYVEGR